MHKQNGGIMEGILALASIGLTIWMVYRIIDQKYKMKELEKRIDNKDR